MPVDFLNKSTSGGENKEPHTIHSRDERRHTTRLCAQSISFHTGYPWLCSHSLLQYGNKVCRWHHCYCSYNERWDTLLKGNPAPGSVVFIEQLNTEKTKEVTVRVNHPADCGEDTTSSGFSIHCQTATCIIADPSHRSHELFTLLPSGKRYRNLMTTCDWKMTKAGYVGLKKGLMCSMHMQHRVADHISKRTRITRILREGDL